MKPVLEEAKCLQEEQEGRGLQADGGDPGRSHTLSRNPTCCQLLLAVRRRNEMHIAPGRTD